MRYASMSLLFINRLSASHGSIARGRSSEIDSGEGLRKSVGSLRSALSRWLSSGMDAADARMLGRVFALLRENSRRRDAREFAATLERLEELSPHLLDDIGVRKLQSGDFEMLTEAGQARPTPTTREDRARPPDRPALQRFSRAVL